MVNVSASEEDALLTDTVSFDAVRICRQPRHALFNAEMRMQFL